MSAIGVLVGGGFGRLSWKSSLSQGLGSSSLRGLEQASQLCSCSASTGTKPDGTNFIIFVDIFLVEFYGFNEKPLVRDS